MKITKIDNTFLESSNDQYTEEDLLNEYDAYICNKIINQLRKLDLITDIEKQLLQTKIIDQFTPYLSKIVTQIT